MQALQFVLVCFVGLISCSLGLLLKPLAARSKRGDTAELSTRSMMNNSKIPRFAVVGTSESNNNPLDELYDNIYRRVKSFIIESKKFIEEKKMSTKLSKDTIAKAGLYALLSYGFVSNVSYITCLIISWVTHGKRTGLSPLAPGQWKGFLAIYAAFFAANNIIRPLRFSVAMVLAPAFERIIDKVQEKTGLKRAVSTGIVVFAINVCGTISYLLLGLSLATSIARVPLFP